LVSTASNSPAPYRCRQPYGRPPQPFIGLLRNRLSSSISATYTILNRLHNAVDEGGSNSRINSISAPTHDADANRTDELMLRGHQAMLSDAWLSEATDPFTTLIDIRQTQHQLGGQVDKTLLILLIKYSKTTIIMRICSRLCSLNLMTNKYFHSVN